MNYSRENHNELTQHPAIVNASQSSEVPTERLTSFGGTSVQQGDSLVTTELFIKDVLIDSKYFDTYQIPLVSGHNFFKNIASDDSTSFILSESAVRMVGWTNEEAVGQMIKNGEIKTINLVVKLIN